MGNVSRIGLDLGVRAFKNHPEISFFVHVCNLSDEQARVSTSFLKNVAPLPDRDVRLGAALAF